MLKRILQIFNWRHLFQKRCRHPPVLPFLTPQKFQQNDWQGLTELPFWSSVALVGHHSPTESGQHDLSAERRCLCSERLRKGGSSMPFAPHFPSLRRPTREWEQISNAGRSENETAVLYPSWFGASVVRTTYQQVQYSGDEPVQGVAKKIQKCLERCLRTRKGGALLLINWIWAGKFWFELRGQPPADR